MIKNFKFQQVGIFLMFLKVLCKIKFESRSNLKLSIIAQLDKRMFVMGNRYKISVLAFVVTFTWSSFFNFDWSLGITGDLYVNTDCGNDSWSGIHPDCIAPDGPKATIQAAINIANDGDVIVVIAGIYTGPGNRDLDFQSKAITLSSTDPPDPAVVAATVIDGEDTTCVAYLHSETSIETEIAGMTLTRGNASHKLNGSSCGGAIYCDGVDLTLNYCRICDNYANIGGGVYARNCDLTLNTCEIVGNTAEDEVYGFPPIYIPGGAGGGVYWTGTSFNAIDCLIDGNVADTIDIESGGGGMSLSGIANIQWCRFVDNSGYYGSALGCGKAYIDHCLFYSNGGGTRLPLVILRFAIVRFMTTIFQFVLAANLWMPSLKIPLYGIIAVITAPSYSLSITAQ